MHDKAQRVLNAIYDAAEAKNWLLMIAEMENLVGFAPRQFRQALRDNATKAKIAYCQNNR